MCASPSCSWNSMPITPGRVAFASREGDECLSHRCQRVGRADQRANLGFGQHTYVHHPSLSCHVAPVHRKPKFQFASTRSTTASAWSTSPQRLKMWVEKRVEPNRGETMTPASLSCAATASPSRPGKAGSDDSRPRCASRAG